MNKKTVIEAFLRESFVADDESYVLLERAQQVLDDFCKKNNLGPSLVGVELFKVYPHTKYSKALIDGCSRVVFKALKEVD